MALHPFLDFDGPIAFAHRGGAHEAPENTIEAFRHAASLGYRYIETDAQLTADGIPVAFHDPRIDRVTDQEGAVADLTWAQLAELTIHSAQGGGHLATIAELLVEFPTMRFNIDAKSSAVVNPLIDAIVAANALDRVCIASFFDHRIAGIRRRLGDDVCLSQGPIESMLTLALGAAGTEYERTTRRPLQLPDTVGR